jgi:hypothetical protein
MELRNREGFAMPMAIFTIAVLSAALAAAYSNTTTEMTTNTAVRAQNRSYQIAEAGLEQFLSLRGTFKANGSGPWCDHCANPVTADSEWTRVPLVGGYADVVAVKVRPVVGTSNAVYFIRSTGTDTSARINPAKGTSYAQRTVGIYATWVTNTMNVKAAWLSYTGLTKNGAGLISGIDDCGQQPAVAGVMVDKGDLDVEGNSFNPLGTPPVDTSKTFAQLLAENSIDWNAITNGNAIPADIEIPGGTFPSEATFDANPDYWPIIRIRTNGYSLPNRGRGFIIADSDIVVSGSNMWNGIILVGEQLTSNGNNTVAGATVTGLNYTYNGRTPTLTTKSNAIDDNSIANGTKTYVYNSCYVSMASQQLRRYVTMSNSWMDNLTSW